MSVMTNNECDRDDTAFIDVDEVARDFSPNASNSYTSSADAAYYETQ
jgi:hypothetical protein